MDTRPEFVTLEQEAVRKYFPTDYNRESSIGLGYRVPLVIASPWSRGGFVNSQVFDHTSVLQFLEIFLAQKTGKKITETNISDWRRTICGNLSSVFRPDQPEKDATPAFLSRDEVLVGIKQAEYKKLPDDYKLLSPEAVREMGKDLYGSPYMPKQEKGIRPSCALPYELYADGNLSADKKSFSIRFRAGNTAFGKTACGSPFSVYAPGKYRRADDPHTFQAVRTWAYGVKAGAELEDEWPLEAFGNERYHLRVYGPNGFYREFTGGAEDPAVEVSCEYETMPGTKNILTGNIKLVMRNMEDRGYTLEITDNAYKSPAINKTLQQKGKAGASGIIIRDLSKSYGWYDFSVKFRNPGSSFEKRYAGRVETGKHGYSDPFMGRML
jgi:phospholipase C